MPDQSVQVAYFRSYQVSIMCQHVWQEAPKTLYHIPCPREPGLDSQLSESTFLFRVFAGSATTFRHCLVASLAPALFLLLQTPPPHLPPFYLLLFNGTIVLANRNDCVKFRNHLIEYKI